MKQITCPALLSCLLLLAGGAFAENQVQTQTKTVKAPESKRMAVHTCLKTGGPCGQAAADKYCTSIGYAKATAFSQAPASKPAVMLASKEVCQPTFGAAAGLLCMALKNVTCERTVIKKQPGLTPDMPDQG